MPRMTGALTPLVLWGAVLLAGLSPFHPAVSLAQASESMQPPPPVARAQFQWNDAVYTVELLPGRDAEVTEGAAWCANPEEAGPELAGPCEIVLRKDGRQVSSVRLEGCLFIRSDQGWGAPGPPLSLLPRPHGLPVVVAPRYRDCNGYIFRLFAITDGSSGLELRPLLLDGAAGVAGSRVWLVPPGRPPAAGIWIEGYDNQLLGWFLRHFQQVEGEEYGLVGLYSEAGATYTHMRQMLNSEGRFRGAAPSSSSGALRKAP